MKRRLYLTLAALSVATVGSAYATNFIENDALAIANAKISMIQAVTAAEHHVGGRAARAEYERHDGQWVFDVEVVKGRRVLDVKVDPASGAVLASNVDESDHDGDHDKTD
jgi:uncharacterized membrane protein YkoI